MSDLDLLLHNWLPRPALDPGFRKDFEELILCGGLEADEVSLVGGRRRRYYIGGAVFGAAALAVGAVAAVGWLRLWGTKGKEAKEAA